MRDGQPHYLTGSFGPPYLPQSKHKDPAKQELMRAKEVKVWRLEYIKAEKIKSGTSFFSVDKGAMDIRIVYNGTSCGLNDIVTPLASGCLLYERPCGPSYQVSSSVTLTCKTNF